MFKSKSNLKYIIYGIATAIICLLGYRYFESQGGPAPKRPIIAITQIAPHPSLDAIRQGLMDELQKGGIDPSQIVFENASGSISTATQIAQKLVGLNPAVIVPITTPSAQTVYGAAKGFHIPVIFAAISDPVAAKLLVSMDQPQEGISGVSDLSPVNKQVALIRQILPRLNRLGVVYSTGEANSVALVDLLEESCANAGIQLKRSATTRSAEVPAAVKALVGEVDAIYVPNDNMVVSALPSLLSQANSSRLPVFCADPESVAQGCLATISHNQYKLGTQVGQMVLRLLGGQEIKNIKPEMGKYVELAVNQKQAQFLGIQLPDDVLKKARILDGDSKPNSASGRP